MSSNNKYSRRCVIKTIIDMLEIGTPTKRVAQVLAAYLIKTRQTRNTELYLRDLELEILARFNTATTHVHSAKVLSQTMRRRVKKLILETTGAQKIEIIETIDPNLIGGIIIKTADSELDGSVRTKLQQLRSV